MGEDLTVLLEEMVRRWRKEDVVLRPGNSIEDIRIFERREFVSLPEDVARYFQTVDGMEEGDWDEDMIRFWPLSEVRPVVELTEADPSTHDGYFVFADFSLWCHAYAIRLSEGEAHDIVVLAFDDPIRMADSFTEFLEKYLFDPRSLWV